MSNYELKHFTKEEIEELKSIFVERHRNNFTERANPLPSMDSTTKPTCPKCGLVLESSMMYACLNKGCPTGLGTRY